MAPIHDRMPVVLEHDDWSTWLDTAHSDRNELASLMIPADENVLRVIDVAPIVNSIRNNGPELIEPIAR
jgi:putative SOS response-associated peptidase YedK